MSGQPTLRIGVFGASGRVGKLVVEAVLAAPDLTLVAAAVSAASPVIGKPVPGSDIVYGPLDKLPFAACDVVVDFSRPAATLELLNADGDGGIPVVIGTTGFDSSQSAMIAAAAHRRPIVLGANFGRGFPTFLRLASALAAAEPDAAARISEIYHARKKKEPSGTSALLADAVAAASGRAAADIPIDVVREGETVGVNAVMIDFGPAAIEVRYTVHSLASYAEGALAAARWAIGCKPGLYGLAEIGTEGVHHDT
jgi:4-hydroxy-tetrahydrodipicolinate reductase